MSQEDSLAEAAGPCKKGEDKEDQQTSDYYQVHENLPPRFNRPGWFRGYRIKERNPLFRTTNMDYGRKPPTVHEMPTCFHVSPHTFTDHLIKFGMYRNTGINTSTEKSDVTGPDNLITYFDTFNFHPSYRTGGPSFCE
ncbi:piercer of microtubule wall 1 protein isoform X2 [Eublepharis macularius]|uniref:Piercer of microtubule wall 1 protein isoform X2 n=1 Tax=Eublepharis macularius TaxID=481883 RepID=A0AA97KC40_EUBMA|nr:piercer of microtubule wall 1 protein isoform X2 [Eublepharis macularius]